MIKFLRNVIKKHISKQDIINKYKNLLKDYPFNKFIITISGEVILPNPISRVKEKHLYKQEYIIEKSIFGGIFIYQESYPYIKRLFDNNCEYLDKMFSLFKDAYEKGDIKSFNLNNIV